MKYLLQRFLEGRGKPVRFVSEQEFILALMANGQTEDEAKRQAKISRALGSSVTVGEKRLMIQPEHSGGQTP